MAEICEVHKFNNKPLDQACKGASVYTCWTNKVDFELLHVYISKGLLIRQSFVNSKLLELTLKIPFPLYVICLVSHEHTSQNQQERLVHLHSLGNKPKIDAWVTTMHIYRYMYCKITSRCSTAVLNAKIDKQKGISVLFWKAKCDEHKPNHQFKDNYGCTVYDDDSNDYDDDNEDDSKDDNDDEGVCDKLSSAQECTCS